MPKKMRGGGGMAAKPKAMPKKMRGGGGMTAKPKAMPMKKGGRVKGRSMPTPVPPMEMTEKKVTPVMPDESGGRKKLKPAPNKGASMLPKPVRNKMGFMRNGGAVKKAAGGGVNKSAVRSSSKKPL
tara:strand:+ start:2914 stop:3291 length:378 start_codon:yes stop_codon:yes gene_type:complete